MNPAATARLRRLTAAIAVVWALAVLVLTVVGEIRDRDRLGPPFLVSSLAGSVFVVEQVTPQAAQAGIERGQRLVAIDGQPPEAAFLHWRASFRPGHPNRYRLLDRDGRVHQASLAPASQRGLVTPVYLFLMVALPAVGLMYIGVGLWVWVLRTGRSDAWAFLLFCATMAANLFATGRFESHVGTLQWMNVPMIGATAFHLFTTYPIEPTWIVRTRGIRGLVYELAALLGVLAAFEIPLGLPAGVFKLVAFYFTNALAGVCLVSVWRERMRVRDSAIADRVDFVMLAATVSFLPIVVVLIAQRLLQTAFPWYLALLWFAVFPLAMGYGIARKRLFEMRRVAASSATYAAATLAITGLYAFLITFADALVSYFHIDARSPWFSVVFLFFAILAFNPLRTRMQRLVDRIFDRDRSVRTTYARAVREISEALVSMHSTKEIVDRLLIALTDTMGIGRALVLLANPARGELEVVASQGEWDEEARSARLPLDHPICERLRELRHEVTRADFDDERDLERRDACRDVFDTLEVELLVPMHFAGDLLGVIAVTRRISGERLRREDRQLLRTLANQSAIAIQNARAFDEIQQLNATLESRVEERTRELREAQNQLMHSEKMASLGQLVAGIAHELNNPIGFVHANLKLLEEYVRKLIAEHRAQQDDERTRDAILRLLARSHEGTSRVKKIVEDLRVFSRMDNAEPREADLTEEIDRALTLMEPRLREGIRVVRDFEPLPKVRCHAGQLAQVFMNLIANACDATGPGGTLTIRARPTRDGVRIEFEDDGPGIPPEVLGRIFEPFYTTKPVGKGTGLGLSLSHGIVERHGGRIWAESEPGRGARFVIELPLDTPRAAA